MNKKETIKEASIKKSDRVISNGENHLDIIIETIQHAAWMRNDGILEIGRSHSEILPRCPYGTCKKGSTTGFVTSTGRYIIDRQEALEIAIKAGQIDPNLDTIRELGLLSENFWSDSGYKYDLTNNPPKIGDVVYGKIISVGQHSQIENKNGRLHNLYDGLRSVFVFGNRYAPDYYEGIVPDDFSLEIDMLARSGVVGKVLNKNIKIKDPTKVKILGYVVDENGEIINTLNFSIIKSHKEETKRKNPKLILNIGSSMNSGKSLSSASCCKVLSLAGHKVTSSKITGTASLKDILNMEDCGSSSINDFTYMGYPSTYLLSEEELVSIFNTIDKRNSKKTYDYWIVEIADGILQRETAMLLKNDIIRNRIYKLIYSAPDALSVLGGIKILKEDFGLVPDAISGICSGSPLSMAEAKEKSDIPIFNNINPNMKELLEILL